MPVKKRSVSVKRRTTGKRTGSGKRTADVSRKTKETDIRVQLDLDGKGAYTVSTGLPFLNHMLESFTKHSGFDLAVKASGDTDIDDHHLMEDLAIVLGDAVRKAVGDKKGIARYGSFVLPMDETLAEVALDLSDRPYFVWNVKWVASRIKKFDALLLEHFFETFAMNARINLHMTVRYGKHPHHMAESLFKALARALSQAVQRDTRFSGVPSTKGAL